MKKLLLSAAALATAAMSLYAASDRLDIYKPDGSFVSVMVDDIKKVTVGDKQGDAYQKVVVELNDNQTIEGVIAEINGVYYRLADNTTLFEIGLYDAPNAVVNLLDSRNNYGIMDPTKPDDWRASEADRVPHFLIDTDKGYESTYTIVGKYTGKEYSSIPGFVFWSDHEDNLLGIDCWAYTMPFEPVDMTAYSEILHTYDDEPFLGTYNGCEIKTSEGHLVANAEHVFQIEMRGNETYTFTSTDEQAFNVLDLYVYNYETKSFAYVPYQGELKNEIDLEVKFGAYGQFLDDDMIYISVIDIITNKPENTRHYLVAKDNYTYAVANADQYGFRNLVEAAAEGKTTKWYYLEDYGTTMTAVEMQFTTGSSIGDDNCTAFAVANGEKLFKYVKQSGAAPEFVLRGNEYGTYTGAAGELVLDGFNNATLGETAYTYTLQDGLLTLSTEGVEAALYVIDITNKTYEQVIRSEWTGPKDFVREDALGAFNGGEETSDNYVRIAIDQNLNGSENVGTCAIEVKIARHDGFDPITAIASSGKYIYDAEGKRIIVTNVLYGTGAYSSSRHNLVLKVSDDLKTIWFDDSASDKVYSTSRDNSYIIAGESNALTAESTAPELAASYSGNLQLIAFGSPADAPSTLSFDTTNSTASLSVTGFGTTLLNAENIAYVVEGQNVTLKDVVVADPSDPYGYTTMTTNLTFVLQDDGTLVGQGNTNVAAMGMLFELQLEGCVLTAE